MVAVLLFACGAAFGADWCAVPSSTALARPIQPFINREGVTRDKGVVQLSAAFLRQRFVSTKDGVTFQRRGEPFVPGVWSVWSRLTVTCSTGIAKADVMRGLDSEGQPIGESTPANREQIEPGLGFDAVVDAVCDAGRPRRSLRCSSWSVPESQVFRPADGPPSREERKRALAAYWSARSAAPRPH